MAGITPPTIGPVSTATTPSAKTARAFVDDAGQGRFLDSVESLYESMANGFVSLTGNEAIDSLFSRGGMASMLTTVWLILGALSTGFLVYGITWIFGVTGETNLAAITHVLQTITRRSGAS